MRRALLGSAMVCGTLLLSACAAPRPPVATHAMVKSAPRPAANGTIVAVRPVTDQELAESAQWRAVLMRGADPVAGARPSGLMEVVVRDDSGRTTALIQPAQAGCAAGGRVLLLPGELARCAGF